MRALLPSLLAADFYQLKDQIEELEKNGVHSLHMDIMDGKNVPSISFGMPVLSAIRKHTKLFFDVHMMVDEPDRFIDDMVIAGADMIRNVPCILIEQLHIFIQKIFRRELP